MKKWIFAFFTLILCLVFIDKVEAQDFGCMYEGKNDDGSKFKVFVRIYDSDSVYIQPLDDVRVDKLNKNYGNDDLWTSYDFGATIKVKDSNSPYDGDKLNHEIIEEEGCFNYLYWQAPAGLDKWFFSNSSNQSISGTDKIARLSLVENYQDTSNNAILNELVCTYQGNIEGTLAPDTIIYRLEKEGDGYSYSLMGESSGNIKYFYEGDVSADANGWYSLAGMMQSLEVYDLLNPRVFWYSETKAFSCPTMIMLGYSSESLTPAWSSTHVWDSQVAIGFPTSELDRYLDSKTVSDLDALMEEVNNAEYQEAYSLTKSASLIDFDKGEDEQGQICNYGIESEMAENLDNWYYSVRETKPFGESSFYQIFINDTSPEGIPMPGEIDIPSGKLMKSCDDLPYLYTDCLNGDTTDCKISATQFSGSTRLVQNAVLNEMDRTTIELGMSKYNGYMYKFMMCELGDRLNALTTNSALNLTENITFYDYNGSSKETFKITNLINNQCENGWNIKTGFSCNDKECQKSITYVTEKKIKEIVTYCNEIYGGYNSTKLNNSSYIGRMEECIQFHKFYESLVSNGIIDDLTVDCDVLSNEFVEKLIWFLDIIKIAGPLLALGLGTLDFIRTVASGDADKEMKNTFKRFSTRLISAALLFLVPFILAFLMDMFLGNQNGYDVDNPFCGVEDFKE